MGTKSYIGKLNYDGTVSYIYCHYDGAPAHQMPILEVAYNSEDVIDHLLLLKDISHLSYSTAKPPVSHTESSPADGFCLAYERDCGETGLSIHRAYSKESYIRMGQKDVDFTYLYVDGHWVYYPNY